MIFKIEAHGVFVIIESQCRVCFNFKHSCIYVAFCYLIYTKFVQNVFNSGERQPVTEQTEVKLQLTNELLDAGNMLLH